VMLAFWPASSQQPIGSPSATVPSPTRQASKVAVIVLVTDPISNRPSAGMSSLAAKTGPATSMAVTATAIPSPFNSPSTAAKRDCACSEAQLTPPDATGPVDGLTTTHEPNVQQAFRSPIIVLPDDICQGERNPC
jgi:hypothetical protein